MRLDAKWMCVWCLSVGFLLTGCAGKNRDAKVKEIQTAAELKEKMDVSNVLVIHALNEEHYAKGHVPGATNIDYEKMTPQMLPENKDQPLVFYCGSSSCPVGERAANKAADWGHTNVWVYKGGMADWRASGMPVATGTE